MKSASAGLIALLNGSNVFLMADRVEVRHQKHVVPVQERDEASGGGFHHFTLINLMVPPSQHRLTIRLRSRLS